MTYNIVTNYKISQIFRHKSRYFKVNLGLASTAETPQGDRFLNTKDSFAYFYNTTYTGATILGQGSIGDIKIYSDPYIKEDKIAFYFDKEEFIFDFDEKMVNEKGVDFYLGHLIKTIELQYDERQIQKKEQVEIQKKQTGDVSKILANPGNVSYADLMAYMQQKNADRLGS
jgi:hypothetical protein